MSARTLTELFFDAVERYANHPAAFRYKADGTWRSVTHRAVAERVQALAVGLRELSLGAGEKVAILSETRLEWTLADYACLCIRATDVPIYPTLPANQVEYILRDSGAAAVFCSTAAQVEKIQAVRAVSRRRAARPSGGGDVSPLQGGRAGGATGRPRDADLHVGHHRTAQGRHAQPW